MPIRILMLTIAFHLMGPNSGPTAAWVDGLTNIRRPMPRHQAGALDIHDAMNMSIGIS
ncbi:MAG TPA: hypothetical protein VIO80_08135 [Candidatus Dormibacteraeota bacterium]